MFNVLHDRILIINRAGKVVYANASARADFSGELSALLIESASMYLNQAA
jgi:hypothetical protein